MEYQQVADISQSARRWETEPHQSHVSVMDAIHPILRLQNIIGNRGVQRLIQAKLAIRSADDIYELEAERVAKQVVGSSSEPAVQRKCACGGTAGPNGECGECREKRILPQRVIAHELSHVAQQSGAGGGAFIPGVVQRQESPSRPPVPDHVDDESKQATPPSKPILPIPVFDQLDPMVSVPSVPGVPDVLKGASLKLSDVKKGLDAVRGLKEKPGNKCGPPFLGFEKASSGPFKGLCCKGPMRSLQSCCDWRQIALVDNRCCTGLEVIVQERCLPLKLAPLPPPQPAPPPEFNDLPENTLPPGTALA
jgi:hypothetical protein